MTSFKVGKILYDAIDFGGIRFIIKKYNFHTKMFHCYCSVQLIIGNFSPEYTLRLIFIILEQTLIGQVNTDNFEDLSFDSNIYCIFVWFLFKFFWDAALDNVWPFANYKLRSVKQILHLNLFMHSLRSRKSIPIEYWV